MNCSNTVRKKTAACTGKTPVLPALRLLAILMALVLVLQQTQVFAFADELQPDELSVCADETASPDNYIPPVDDSSNADDFPQLEALIDDNEEVSDVDKTEAAPDDGNQSSEGTNETDATEEQAENEDESEEEALTDEPKPEQYFVIEPPLSRGARGINPLGDANKRPDTLLVQVTLYPPDYGVSSITGEAGFRGSEWAYIAEHGFDLNYNSMSIVSGYDGNDWIYGVSGDNEHNAVFAANSTIHCVDPGLTPPCPGGDNSRQIVMYYREEITYGDKEYYLYWGSSTFNYSDAYAYGGGAQRMGLFVAIPRHNDVEVIKLDKDTQKPVPDTEFTLLRYPVHIENGVVITDTARIAFDDPAWVAVGSAISNKDGRLTFTRLPFGYYQIIESRPNPLYKGYEESGGTPRFVKIDRYSTPELQVFEDELIQIGVEVYKNTIQLTSAAFQTAVNDHLIIDNTSVETYHYDLYFRSTSNVRADEFVVIDPLENVSAEQVRVEALFTPVAWGDTDGYFSIWYQTNRTDKTYSYTGDSALATNPDNPNNPGRQQVWPSTGWKLWCGGIPTTISMALWVSDLNLAEDEYISALRFDYGSVEIGFTTLNGPLSTQQNSKTAKPSAIDWTPQPADRFFAEGALQAVGLKPVTYLVTCPKGMNPPTVITSTVTAHIARNLVLTDSDFDDVFTEVIKPFLLEPKPYEPAERVTRIVYEKPINHVPRAPYLPKTGDTQTLGMALLAMMSLLTGCQSLHRRAKRS